VTEGQTRPFALPQRWYGVVRNILLSYCRILALLFIKKRLLFAVNLECRTINAKNEPLPILKFPWIIYHYPIFRREIQLSMGLNLPFRIQRFV
jgi:hypothetical protein